MSLAWTTYRRGADVVREGATGGARARGRARAGGTALRGAAFVEDRPGGLAHHGQAAVRLVRNVDALRPGRLVRGRCPGWQRLLWRWAGRGRRNRMADGDPVWALGSQRPGSGSSQPRLARLDAWGGRAAWRACWGASSSSNSWRAKRCAELPEGLRTLRRKAHTARR